MADSSLIFYLPIENFGEKSDYWKTYADFYEKYWGGPTSPFGVWFGNEYENFRNSLSANIGIEEELIEDCFFMKDKHGRYYVAPLGSKEGSYLLYSENHIPVPWFIMFDEEERKSLYTHWGFNAISYDTKIDLGLQRLNESYMIVSTILERRKDEPKLQNAPPDLQKLKRDTGELRKIVSRFDPTGYVVLNYGELCSFIHPYTIKNENSVGEVRVVLNLLGEGRIDEAKSSLMVLEQKWADIKKKASGQIDDITIQ